MTELEGAIKKLEGHLQQLLKKTKRLEEENRVLLEKKEQLEEEQQILKNSIDQMRLQNHLLKSAGQQLSPEEKKETEKQLQFFLREIDRCIGLISR